MSREQILERWLQDVLKTSDFKRDLLAGDASFRRYYRVCFKNRHYVVMDAPPPEMPHVFAEVAGILQKQGLSVPQIISHHVDEGFLLLSDLGDRLYLNELNDHTADRLYQDAFSAMLKIQQCETSLPPFDRAFLQRQLGIFEEWYLKKHKAVEVSACNDTLMRIYEGLFQVVESQPQVVVHRDYHSRNLMFLEEGNPGILDFQDAMSGPITYDLVSLLQDYYIVWPRERVVKWVVDYHVQAKQIGVLGPKSDFFEFLRWFDWTGLHRHLKNLGIFARLHYRDHKSGYLKEIPQVLNYILETCSRYPELQSLGVFFDTLNCEVREI
jgi:aminoglycoside/choline kinase family phosphotransferase